MSPGCVPCQRAVVGFPRVSGDEPRLDVARTRGIEFSPRERG